MRALGTCCRTHFCSPLKGATEQIVASKKALDKLRADECWTRDWAEIQSTVKEIRVKRSILNSDQARAKSCQGSSFSQLSLSGFASKRISGVDCNGDDIRRVAGTVGTVSPLFKIKESFQVLSRPGTCLMQLPS